MVSKRIFVAPISLLLTACVPLYSTNSLQTKSDNINKLRLTCEDGYNQAYPVDLRQEINSICIRRGLGGTAVHDKSVGAKGAYSVGKPRDINLKLW